jgi:spermidine/putrescine transport system permease protein
LGPPLPLPQEHVGDRFDKQPGGLPGERPQGSPTSAALRARLLALPAAAFVLVFLLAPIALLGLTSFWRSSFFETTSDWNLDQYGELLGSAAVWRSLVRSVLTGLAVGAISTVIAFPVAWYLRFRTGTFRIIVLGLTVTALFSSYLVRIYAWRTLLGREGAINWVLQELGVIDTPSLIFFYNRFAVILTLVHIFLPFATLVLFASLGAVGREIVEAARTLGASWRQIQVHVVLPIVSPGLFSAFVFAFILSAGDYVTPQFVGGTGGTLIGQQIAVQFVQNGDYSQGAALSLLFMLTVILAAAVAYAVGRIAYRAYR